MDLRYVTITGADDLTPIEEMVELSLDFPFVEWGILLGSEVKGRFPSKDWLNSFARAAENNFMNTALHLCGPWVKRLLAGEYIWTDISHNLLVAIDRVQINMGGKPQVSNVKMIDAVRLGGIYETIVQGDGVNDHLAYALTGNGIRTSILYDLSGGRGIFPTSWPRPDSYLPCGYAGGISPDNMAQVLTDLGKVCKQPFWIDMESGVRTDNKLDLGKVRTVLTQAKEIKKIRSRSNDWS